MGIFDVFKKKNVNNGQQGIVNNVVLSEKDVLINKIGTAAIDDFCNKYFLNTDALTIDFLKKIDSSREVLDFLCNNYISSDSVKKIINGIYTLKEASSNYEYDTLKYPILFKEEDRERLSLLNKDIDVSGEYASVEMDNLDIGNLSLNKSYNRVISSYFNGIDIKKEEVKLLDVELGSVYSSSDVNVLFPVEKVYYNTDFSYCIDSEVNVNDKMIVIISLDKFISLTDEEIKAFGKCNFVLKEDVKKLTQINDKFNSFNNLDSLSNGNNKDDEIIKVNHLLFVIDNSNLDVNKKKYFRYEISKYYHKGDMYFVNDIVDRVKELVNDTDIRRLSLIFDNLSYEEKTQNIESVAYDMAVFIGSINNIDIIETSVLLDRVCALSEEERSIVLSDAKIRERLCKGILDNCRNDIYAYFDRLKLRLSVVDIMSLIDVKLLKKHFVGDLKYDEYKIFSSLCQNNEDTRKIVSYVLNDDKLFEEFFNQSSNFYSVLGCLDGELLKDVLFKLREKGMSDKCYDFVPCLSFEAQKYLIDEKLDDDFIAYLVPKLRPEAINYFFVNDKRSNYLFNNFNITSMAENGVIFNDEVLKSDKFFDSLKGKSLIDFRNNINVVEMNNLPEYIESKIGKYYDELLASYDESSGMFREYLEIMNNPDDFRSYSKFNDYIMDDEAFDISRMIRGNNNDNCASKFKTLTSKKISEIVVDGLFSDNYYNVCSNIWEMFRFNSKLSLEERVLDKDKEEFYQLILDFDKTSCGDKIKLYRELKDKNINLMFYEDLRKLKDKSYDMIKSSLFNAGNSELDKELSDKYGTMIYDMRGKDFFMLVRSMAGHRDDVGVERACYSIISNDNTRVFTGGSATIYGYNSFENDRVLHMFEQDSFSADSRNDSLSSGSKRVNRIMTAEELANGSSWYSEVQLVNLKKEENVYTAKKPDFIVVYDEPSEINIAESKARGIPIVIIRRQALERDKKVDISMSGRPTDEIKDAIYINSFYDERDYGKKNR